MENFGSAAQLFPAFVLVVGRIKFGGSVFRWSDFPSFLQLLPNFQNFPAYGSAFPAAVAATAAAFPAFWCRSSRIATGAAAQVGMALSWNHARLVKFGSRDMHGRTVKFWKIGKFWMNCQILVKELPNSGKT